MNPFRYTLVADGPSDRSLLPIIDWVLAGLGLTVGIAGQMADFRYLTTPPSGLVARIRLAFTQYPCDLLFIHRDAEAERMEIRAEEIRAASEAATVLTYVPVIPVRMTEAWLLIDENAIRRSADNPSGTNPLPLPAIGTLEATQDPKRALHECLLVACDLGRRQRDQFQRRIGERVQRVAFLINDFGPLERLPAFRTFRDATHSAVERILADGGGGSPED